MYVFFFFSDTATTEIYTLSLHDALPIWSRASRPASRTPTRSRPARASGTRRSEEHTSELQSRLHLVCRLLLEKKKHTPPTHHPTTILYVRPGHSLPLVLASLRQSCATSP